ncbi:MAG: hypothetical protein LBP90_00025 [Burkholderiales bacterium]|jgi:hypothetical protein|nr:hypothetical protein [Burkholderiales bacterium]
MMENSQEAWSAFDDRDKDKRAEYRFVYNRAEIRKGIIYFLVFFLILLITFSGIYFYFPQAAGEIFKKKIFIFYVFVVTTIPFAFLWLCLPRLSITLNQEGMICAGFWFIRMPRRCAWNELSQIRVNTLSTKLLGRAKIVVRQLIFIHRFGRQYILPISNRKNTIYVGVGHSLSLEEALEKFVGPVEPLSDEDKEKIPALAAFVDLGKEVGHVAYVAVGLVAFAAILGALPNRPFLLDDAIKTPLYWILGLSAGAIACWYMRRIKQKAIMLIPALLLAGVVAFLVIPLASRLPLWLGKEERMAFVVVEEDQEEQRWQATTDSGLVFSLRVRPERRIYKEVGTERVMTLYRGPGSLNALPEHEYRALFHERRRTKADRQKSRTPE